jgi:hypothetical protein
MNPHGPAFREHVATATALLADPVRTLSPSRFSTPDYIAALREVEHLGRLVDAARAALAGNAADRTGGPIDHLGALGYASPVDAVATLTGISDRDAKRRIRTGAALTGEVSLTGAETGPKYPVVTSAVLDGTLGTDAATVLIDALHGVSPRVNPVIIAEATKSLKRLSVSEAVMELDLTGAACIVFQHGSSGRVNIIYRRTDGNVGWVDPPAVTP